MNNWYHTLIFSAKSVLANFTNCKMFENITGSHLNDLMVITCFWTEKAAAKVSLLSLTFTACYGVDPLFQKGGEGFYFVCLFVLFSVWRRGSKGGGSFLITSCDLEQDKGQWIQTRDSKSMQSIATNHCRKCLYKPYGWVTKAHRFDVRC